PAEPHGDSAFDLAAALVGVDQPADVGGVHALQGDDLAGDPMTGEPYALHVEADRARRQIRLAPDLETIADFGSFGVQLRKRNLPVGANDLVVVQAAIVRLAAKMTAGKGH